jgi:hypothetical protein
VTSCATFRKQWASPLFAAVAVLLIAATSMLSSTHLADFDAHTFTETPALELIETGDSGEPTGNSASDIAICLPGLMCHAAVAFLGVAEGTFQAPFSTAFQQPSPGTLPDGQTPDVLTPPPLSMRA